MVREEGCTDGPEGDGCGSDVNSNATKMIIPPFSSFLLMHMILTRWCGWRTIKILSCLTLLARFEKVLILFRYLSDFGKSCPHWFGLQKLAHKGFFSQLFEPLWTTLELKVCVENVLCLVSKKLSYQRW